MEKINFGKVTDPIYYPPNYSWQFQTEIDPRIRTQNSPFGKFDYQPDQNVEDEDYLSEVNRQDYNLEIVQQFKNRIL